MAWDRTERGVRKLKAFQRLAGRWWREVELFLAARFGLATREDRTFFALIPLVGVVAGVLGVVVHELILGVRLLLWQGPDLLEQSVVVPRWLVVAAPTAGGLAVGLLIWLAREPVGGGGGMSGLIEAVALRGGRIAPRGVLLRAVGAIATVGSGGSLGREGPLIRLGAMLASWLGGKLGLPAHRIKILVGCGAAAGMAAVYNVPIGGALFAMEVILGNFALEIFGPLVVASVISTLIAHTWEGNEVAYPMADYGLRSGREVLAYLLLGILCAVASVAIVHGLRLMSKGFRLLRRIPAPLHPAIGGAFLGLIALEVPYVLGSGAEVIELALAGRLALGLLLLLVVMKLVATALTSGSGGAGGLFTPSLFIGAMIGGAYGTVIHDLWPRFTAPPGAYAAVGMAAIAAGTSHAPISAILMLAELTGNRGLILPLMVASITSSLLARKLYPHSMYTEPLARQGIDLSWRMEEAALAGIEVRQLVRADTDTLRPSDSYRTVVERFMTTTRRQRLFVVGNEGQLLGAVSFHDIKNLLDAPDTLTAVLAHDLMAPVETVLAAKDRLHRAAHVFAGSDYERLPVVDGETGRFLGVLGKRDILGIYAQEVLGRPAMLAKLATADNDDDRDTIQLPADFAVRLLPVPAVLVGRTLAEARLPQLTGCRVIELKRRVGDGPRMPLVPDAATQFAADDEILLMGPTPVLEKLEAGAIDFAALLTQPQPGGHAVAADPVLAAAAAAPGNQPR